MNLDDVGALKSGDPSDALGAVESSAQQWFEAIERAHATGGLPIRHGITRVVFCGMGGSGIAGDVLVAVGAQHSSLPIAVVKGYTLPAYVDTNTLVICASYSGNTEETLSCFEQAAERKARLIVIATGGQLAARAAELGVCVFEAPTGLQPRAALPSLLVPALVALQRLDVLPDLSAELAETQGVLAARGSTLGRDVPTIDNEAKSIAQQIGGKLPLIWGQDGPLAVAAYRWRCQINENAKQLAFWSVLPELDHNELVGFERGAPNLGDIALIVLRAPGEHHRVAKRIEVTLAAMRDKVGTVVEAWAGGDSTLARLMSSSILGDFTSVYLAAIRGVDPTPVHVIEGLKKQLGE